MHSNMSVVGGKKRAVLTNENLAGSYLGSFLIKMEKMTEPLIVFNLIWVGIR